MAPEPGDLDYARVGGPPQRWHRLDVFDARTGERMRDVIEANAKEGWFIRNVRNAEGRIQHDGETIRRERVEAAIIIRPRGDQS